MFKASLLSLIILVTVTMAPPAQARHSDEWSSARKTTKHHSYARHRATKAGSASQQRANDVCRNDAVRLCKPVLTQGNMAVLGCFRSHARALSRGCRALRSPREKRMRRPTPPRSRQGYSPANRERRPAVTTPSSPAGYIAQKRQNRCDST